MKRRNEGRGLGTATTDDYTAKSLAAFLKLTLGDGGGLFWPSRTLRSGAQVKSEL